LNENSDNDELVRLLAKSDPSKPEESIMYALNQYYCTKIYEEVLLANRTFAETGAIPIDLFLEQRNFI
jgi:hypothetical protein